MAMRVDTIARQLPETGVTAGGAVLYTSPDDQEELCNRIAELLDHEQPSRELDAAPCRRGAAVLGWSHSAEQLLTAHDRALTKPRRLAGART